MGKLLEYKLIENEELSPQREIDDREPFIDAAHFGRLEDVVTLLPKLNDNLNVLTCAVAHACAWGHMDIIKWLVEHTAVNVNYDNCNELDAYVQLLRPNDMRSKSEPQTCTPLTAACCKGHNSLENAPIVSNSVRLDVVKHAVLENKFLVVSNSEKLDIVKYLVEICRADVNLRDPDGYSPLLTACCRTNKSVAMYFLLEVSNLDVNITNEGNTALHYIVWYDNNRGNTELHEACGAGDEAKVLKVLYECDNLINVQNNDGDTPLHVACYFRRYNVVKTLMFQGADETLINEEMQTPAQRFRDDFEALVLLDRDSLYEVLQRFKVKKLSVAFLIMLAIKPMIGQLSEITSFDEL